MTQTFRPRRSVLYMPGANERALEKAKTLAVDALILDLEDSVAPDAKSAARENVVAADASGEYGGTNHARARGRTEPPGVLEAVEAGRLDGDVRRRRVHAVEHRPPASSWMRPSPRRSGCSG